MNSGKTKVLSWIALAIMTVAFTAACLAWKKPKRISAVFRDGSTATVEKVTVGFQHEFHVGSKLYADLRRKWPRFLPDLPESKYSSAQFTSDQDVLVAWISLRSASNVYLAPDFQTHIEDAHGCVFAHHGSSSSTVGKMQLDRTEQYAFPRREKEFKLVLTQCQGADAVSLTIPNPKTVAPLPWKPEPLPAVRQAARLKVRLKQMEAHNYQGNEKYFAPHFDVEENGQPTRDWSYSMRYSDATGNTGYDFLCPREPAIKLTAEFRKTADAPFGANELWALAELTAPEPGQYHALKDAKTIDGATLQLVALSGPGIVTYANGAPIKAAPPGPATHGLGVTSSSMGAGNASIVESKSDSWVLALVIAGLKPEQDLMIFAFDDRGKKTVAGGYSGAGNIRFISLHMNKATKSIQLNFVVQTRLKMEFMVKPPEPNGP